MQPYKLNSQKDKSSNEGDIHQNSIMGPYLVVIATIDTLGAPIDRSGG